MNKTIAATGLIVFSFILPSQASAASFSKFYIFGDSLSDAGNAYNGTLKQIPASPPYFEGRFSNGDIWTDYLGEQLNLYPLLQALQLQVQVQVFLNLQQIGQL